MVPDGDLGKAVSRGQAYEQSYMPTVNSYTASCVIGLPTNIQPVGFIVLLGDFRMPGMLEVLVSLAGARCATLQALHTRTQRNDSSCSLITHHDLLLSPTTPYS